VNENEAALRELVGSLVDNYGFQGELWSALLDAELAGVGVPESSGGSGGDLADILTVIEELAARGASVPIAVHNTALFALGQPAGKLTTATARVDARGDRLSATLCDVPYADDETVLAIVDYERPPIMVDLSHPSVTIRSAATIAGVPVCEVTLDETPAQVFENSRDAASRIELLRLAELLGAASGAHRMTKNYVGQREQFGAPLSKLPAVQVKLASMRVALTEGRYALTRAAGVVDSRLEHGAVDVAIRFALYAARITMARVATTVWQTSHQLHGAIGVTDEYPLHRITGVLVSGRDAGMSEAEATARLGELVIASGEEALWTAFSDAARSAG
jgi:acyl-CoA dehydrogenase